MSVQPGELIQAGDFVEISGPYSISQPYPDLASCENCVTAIYGMGYGTYGYGQMLPSIVPPVSETVIRSLQEQWTNLGQAMEFIAAHTQTVINTIPEFSQLQPNEPIQATGYDWASAVALLETNRLLWDPSGMESDTLLSSTRIDTWTGTITHEFRADFGSEQAARFFFNAGGQIILQPRITDAPDALSEDWRDLLLLMDQIWVDYTQTTQTGSGGTGSGLGYYDLTDVYQVLFTQSSTGMYALNNCTLWARRVNHTGSHGANGSALDFRLQFSNGAGGTVGGTIQNTVEVLRAATEAVEVAAPHMRPIQNLDLSPVPTYYEFNQDISDLEQDYNVLEAAIAQGYDLIDPLYATIRITSTGVIRSSLTAYPAVLIPPMPQAQSVVLLVLEPGAVIAGAGGAGGTGAPSGTCGCLPGVAGQAGGPALELQFETHVLNYGMIGGGGGGGGGGGAECVELTLANAGGGGGGASFGAGGDTNICGTDAASLASPGDPGELLTGGMGGSAGNALTAVGGSGGSLGQAGEAGQTIHSLGGVGGANGLAIENIVWITSTSYVGDIRGGSS